MAREEIVTIDGARLRCRVDGGTGPDLPWVVFGNSLLTDLSVWDAQVAAIGGRRRVLRYDQRGHGGSDTGDAPPSMEQLGRDLVGLLEQFGVSRCTYVGLSMGVPTGLAAHAVRPDLFERLVFVDGQAATAPGGAASWSERVELARARGMEAFADATAGRWLAPEAQGDERGRRLRRMIAATPLQGFVHGAKCLSDYDETQQVARIACPLLAIAGAEDGAMPEKMEKVFGTVPGARVATVPGAGHLPNLERPEAFNALLLPFLGMDA